MLAPAPAPGPAQRWVCLGTGCAFFTLYVLTAAPGLFWMDSGELTAASYSLGVAHPPGFPLYTLLAKLATLLPIGSIAFRVVLVSAACGAATVAAVYWLCLRLSLALGADGAVALVGGLGAALVVGLSHTFWRQATVAEVYTPSVLLVVVSLVLLLGALDRRDGRLALTLAFVAGLAVGGAHPTFRLLVLPVLLVVWVWALRSGRRYTRAIPALFGLGGLVVLYLAAAADTGRLVDWGNCQTVGTFWDHVTAGRIREASFAPLMFSLRSEVVGPQLGEAVDRILNQFLGLAIPLALVGAWRCLALRGPSRVLGIALLVAGVGDFVYSFWINPMGLADLQNGITTAVCLAVLVGVGIAELASWIGHRSRRLAPAVAAACCVIVALPTALDDAREKLGGAGYGAAAWVDAALDQAPPRAVIFTQSDDLSAGLVFARGVEGARPDVLALVRQHLWVWHYTASAIAADRDPALPHREVREYVRRSALARQRSRLNLLAMLVDNTAGRRPLLWEPGDGADLAAVRRPLIPDVPLFRVHVEPGPVSVPSPKELVERLRVTLRGDRGARAAQIRARQLNAFGMQYLRYPRYGRSLQTARRLFALALKAWPQSVAARVNGGVVLARTADRELTAGRKAVALGLLRDAIKVTERALARQPNSYTALMNAGRFRVRLAQLTDPAATGAAAGELAQARRHFERAKRLHPHRAEPHFNLGVIAARAGRFSVARGHFNRAVQLNPRDEVARSYLKQVEARLRGNK
ncbi:MAG: DUF2723 domain-containing protein [bacterium]